jgi:hypothetical protein
MTPPPDLSVREYDPADRSFLSWTLRTSARRALQHDPLRADPNLDRRVEQAAGRIEAGSRERGWIVLVASWRGERCGLLVAPPAGTLGPDELGVPGLPASRSGARVYVDPWYSDEGVLPALDEAADLARQAARGYRGAPRGSASA